MLNLLAALFCAAAVPAAQAADHWWDHALVYQVYPRSFRDSVQSDGVGDIPGILEKLDHFENIGVDAVWLSPVYESPMADFGYDISDFEAIDPIFGTLEDMVELIGELHDRGQEDGGDHLVLA